jgi:hypothetical protein
MKKIFLLLIISLKKILFPFFNKEKHQFLTNQWWFRTIAVIFMLVFIFGIPSLYYREINEVYNKCIEVSTRSLYIDDYPANYIMECNYLAREAWTWPGIIQDSITNPIIIFYLLQLFFFKIVINYIVLGNKKPAK